MTLYIYTYTLSKIFVFLVILKHPESLENFGGKKITFLHLTRSAEVVPSLAQIVIQQLNTPSRQAGVGGEKTQGEEDLNRIFGTFGGYWND